MTRVLHVIASADPRSGGPIEGARTIGAAWAAKGHVQDLLTLDAPGDPVAELAGGRVIPIGTRRGRTPWGRYGYTPGAIGALRERARDYDAVIVSGLWNYSVMAARFALVRGTTPYFVYSHGMLDPWFRQTYPLKHAAKQAFWLVNEGPLLANAAAVLFTTEEERIVAEGAFRPYRVSGQVVGYGTADVSGDAGAQVAAFRAALPRVGERPFLLFMSRIHPKKGCDLLIGAFARIAAAWPELQLVMAGPDQVGIGAALQAQAAALGIGARVHFPGMLDGDVKWGAFRACAAFALTSHQENFGVAVVEAMACRRPVLISDKVNIWREVSGDGAGLVAPDTAAGSAELLARFAAMTPEARDAMGARGRASFLRRYTVEAAAEVTMRVIEAGIAARRSAGR